MYKIIWSKTPAGIMPGAPYNGLYKITHFEKKVLWWTRIDAEESLTHHFSIESILNVLKSDGYLILDLSRDPVYHYKFVDEYSYLLNLFRDNNISIKRLIVICPSLPIHFNKNNPTEYKHIFYNSLIQLTSENFKHTFLDKGLHKNTDRNITKYFLSLSRKDNFFRRYLNFKLHDNNLLEKGFISHNRIKEPPEIKEDMDLLRRDLRSLIKAKRHSKSYASTAFLKHTLIEKKPIDDKASSTNDYLFHTSYSNKVFFELVNETDVHAHTLFITEKIFKAILSKNIFIVFGNPYTLAFLKKLGFKTFGHIFDESYDDEKDTFIRLDRILDIVNNLCSIPMTTCKKIYDDNLELLDYNYNHYLNTSWDFKIHNKINEYIRSNHD